MILKCILFLTFGMIIEIPANSELSTIIYDNIDNLDSMKQANQYKDTGNLKQ